MPGTLAGPVPLDAGDLIATAGRLAGTRPPSRFFPALARLTEALDSEARLHAGGRRAARNALIAALVTQAQAAGHGISAGSFDEPTPERPLFLTGMFRTGTTLLQNLLAEHPDVRAPRLWELLAPAAPASTSAERCRLIRSARRYVSEYYAAAPAFMAIHPLAADRPEECHRLTGTTFTADIYCMRYRVPGYAAWLSEQDLTAAYRYHKTLLGCLLRHDPPASGQRLVLKCPSHLWHLDSLAAVYPDARVVRLHRHAGACLPSVCDLTAVIRAARSAYVDKREIGQYWVDHASRVLVPSAQFRLPGLEVLEFSYDRLAADPVGTAAEVCKFAGLPVTEQALWRMRKFLRDHPDGRPGAHNYSAVEFGLNETMLDRRFGEYHAEYNLTLE
jgi:hypothetical protein